jgi:hypothetical protein
LASSKGSTSSIAPTFSPPNPHTVEIAHSAVYNSPTSLSTTQTAHLHTENTKNDISDPYVVHIGPQFAPSCNQSSPKKNRPLNTPISISTTQDTQNEGSAIFLVDLDVHSFTPTPRTSPDVADSSKTPHISMPHHHLPPFPSLQPLNPSPYKRRNSFQSPTAPQNDPSLSKKPSTAHSFAQTGQTAQSCTSSNPTLVNSFDNDLLLSEHFCTTNHDPTQSRTSPTTDVEPQIIDSDIPLSLPQFLAIPSNIPSSFPPVAASQHHTLSTPTPTIIIHAQTVVIGDPASTRISTQNGSTVFDDEHPQHSARNSEDKPQAPVSPATPAMPPRDLSVLRSCHHPFSSLQRRSRRRQSLPTRGFNWNSNLHHRNFSQALQALGWTPPVH